MNIKIIKVISFSIISFLLCSCTTTLEVTEADTTTNSSIPATATAEPTSTDVPTNTPTLEPTATETVMPTATPTSTPVPEYTELGEFVNRVVQVIDFEVVICGPEITEENLDKGIFLYRVDTNEYFCDFVGFTEPVVPPGMAEPQYQYILLYGQFELGEDSGYIFGLVRFNEFLYSYPSQHNIEGVEWTEGEVQSNILRMWPLTKDQFDLLVENGVY
jgi:hypothetical protein